MYEVDARKEEFLMNDLSLGWHDVLRFLAEPLFTLGDTPLSPARLSVVALIFLIAMWFARLGERTLRDRKSVV